MADDLPIEKVPEAARDSPRDFSDRLENDADVDLDLDKAYPDPHGMTPTMCLLYFLLLMVIAGMVGYLILSVLYPEQFAARD